MISIIVPCYNSEQYLVKNLQSLINQKDKGFEVIFINDGSTDNTEIILKDLIKNYNFIKLITVPNSGVMQARKKGLEFAKYDYITFLDVDDALDENFILNFNKSIENNSFDIICCKFKFLKNKSYIYSKNFPATTYNKNDFLETLCCNGGWELWGKVYKKSLFNKIDYSENVTIGEDALVFFQLVCLSNSIKIIDEYLYTYIYYENSASNIKNLDKCRDGIKAALYIKDYLLKNSDLQKRFLDSLVLLFFSNSVRRGFLKNSDSLFAEISQSFNIEALKGFAVKKRLVVIAGYILTRLNF